MYRVVHKENLGIGCTLFIPIPFSHPMESKSEAIEWMVFRGLQKECKVISEQLFKALNGRT